MAETQDSPTWQCLLICWGDRYGAEYVNHTVEAVLRTAASKPRFVLISDRPRPGLHPDVQVVGFDPWYERKEFMYGGVHAKLSMFSKGVVPDDLPTIYIDLDTAIFGDITPALGMMRNRKSVLMFQSVVLPFGWPGRLVYRLTNKKRYARGNSSFVVFHPAECTYISDTFRELYEKHGGYGIRPMIGDERFISWAAQEHINRLPNWFAVKFMNEYMFRFRWMAYARAALPWVKARRRGIAVVTLPGPVLKPEVLVAYKEGDEALEPRKKRWLLWNERALGDMGRRLQEYYRPLIEKLAETQAGGGA